MKFLRELKGTCNFPWHGSPLGVGPLWSSLQPVDIGDDFALGDYFTPEKSKNT